MSNKITMTLDEYRMAIRAEKIRASAERRYLMKHGPKWPDNVKVPVAPICRGLEA